MLYRCLYQSSNMGTNISYLDNMFHIPKYVYEDSKRNCISKYLQDFNLKLKDSCEEFIHIKALTISELIDIRDGISYCNLSEQECLDILLHSLMLY